MTVNQLKRQQAIDALRIAEIDLINSTRPLSQIIYNIEEAMVCICGLVKATTSNRRKIIMSEIKTWRKRCADKGHGFSQDAQIVSMIDEITELRAALADAEKDAARYRWLRDPCSGAEKAIMYSRGDYGFGLYSHTALDKAIDQAMQGGE